MTAEMERAACRVVTLVREQDLAGDLRQHNIRCIQITALPRRQTEARRVAQCITTGVDFGTQTAFGPSDAFGF